MEKKTNYSIQTLLESRSFLYVLLLIVTICFVSTYTKIYDVKLDMNGDNIHYYALGKALAEGKGFTNTISFSETPHTHFPPGYPVFVAGVMKFFPDNINAVKIANGILLYAAILLLFFLFHVISFFLLLFSGFFVYLCTRKPMKLKNYVEITVKVMVAATAP